MNNNIEINRDLLKEVVLSGCIEPKNLYFFQRQAIIITLFLQTGQAMTEQEIDAVLYSDDLLTIFKQS